MLEPTAHSPWGLQQDYQCVSIRDLAVSMAIGIAKWEREPGTRQRVVVSVDLYRQVGPASRDDTLTIDDCIDYNTVREYVMEQWSERPHTDLLETLAEELVQFCLHNDQVQAVRVRLSKPDVYPDTATPSVELYRCR